jgi:hypothetical protein
MASCGGGGDPELADLPAELYQARATLDGESLPARAVLTRDSSGSTTLTVAAYRWASDGVLVRPSPHILWATIPILGVGEELGLGPTLGGGVWALGACEACTGFDSPALELALDPDGNVDGVLAVSGVRPGRTTISFTGVIEAVECDEESFFLGNIGPFSCERPPFSTLNVENPANTRL